MKHLYIVRHAKSSWADAQIPDIDRPLKGRGVTDAYNTAQWLLSHGDKPQQIISSPATRALHTALIFARTFGIDFSEVVINESIYEATTGVFHEIVGSLDDELDTVMMFGHNPTITAFVNQCISHHIDNVPTTGLAYLRFDISSWKNLGNQAELVFFDFPKRRKNPQ